MGLRTESEKPAAVLQVVYVLGWLPALIAGAATRPGAGRAHVMSGAHEAGIIAAAGLGASLTILSIAYLAALRRPPSRRVLLISAGGSVLAVLALPVLFSADVYAYAYYGDLALHAHNPWSHDPAGLGDDPLTTRAIGAWDGHIPPRCVYGPLAVALAAIADAAGAWAGPDGSIAAQRLVAVFAYATFVALVLRLTADPRRRVALALNPVIIWSVGEGHNDAAMVALACAGFVARKRRAIFTVLAGWVKVPALLLTGLERGSARWSTAAAALLGYVPLVLSILADPLVPGRPSPAAWQSPLGLLWALVGRPAAIGFAVFASCAAAWAARRFAPAERTAALALVVWFSLPNAYPWYAWWIVPAAVRRLDSMWSRGLLAASLCAPARAGIDAIFRASNTMTDAGTFHVGMIALEYVPPLLVVAAAARGRRLIVALLLLALPLLAPAAAGAQPTSAPLPAPTANPAPTAQAAPAPQPGPDATMSPTPLATTTPTPLATGPAPTVPPSVPVVVPPTAPPAATAVPNPFNYVITPTPVPMTAPDGPHIIEVLLNDRRIRAGGPLIVRVLTSPNVVGVEARALGRFIPIPQNSPGLFSLAYTMPGGIPFWLLNRNYDIVIAAATADGRQTTVSFPMLLTR